MRTFSVYLKKENQNIDENISRYDLENSGCVIHNPKYVAVYGRYLKLLRKLKYKPMSDEKRNRLMQAYENSARAARFWATLPYKEYATRAYKIILLPAIVNLIYALNVR
jgi:hypothetical protein